IDSSVLLDVLTRDAEHAMASAAALRRAGLEGALMIGECVLAEIGPALTSSEHVEEFMSDLQIEFVPSTRESALLAGDMLRSYRVRRKQGAPGRVVADFLIGAHARCPA